MDPSILSLKGPPYAASDWSTRYEHTLWLVNGLNTRHSGNASGWLTIMLTTSISVFSMENGPLHVALLTTRSLLLAKKKSKSPTCSFPEKSSVSTYFYMQGTNIFIGVTQHMVAEENSFVLHKTQNIYTDIYIQIYTNTLCSWICIRVKVNSSNKKVMITLASKVWHLVNTVHPLWLSVSTTHQWCKQSITHQISLAP